jgi:hypothetical protein
VRVRRDDVEGTDPRRRDPEQQHRTGDQQLLAHGDVPAAAELHVENPTVSVNAQ